MKRAEQVLALVVAVVTVGYAGMLLVRGPPLHHPTQTGRLLRALDVDGSGFLEPAELDGLDPPGQTWHLHDLDGDGRLDARELEIAMEELDPRWLLKIAG